MIARSQAPLAHTPRSVRRLAVLGTALVLVFGLLAAGAARPGGVDATFGLYVSKFKISTISSQTAGVAFNVTVEAQDVWGFRVRSYNGANAKLSGLGTSPNGTAPSGMGVATTWSSGIGVFPVTAVLATSSTSITATDAVRNITKISNNFAVARGALRLSFDAQPLDAKVSTAIKSSLSGDPVKVRAADLFGNVGAGVGVTITAATDPGNVATTIAGGGATNTAADGLASFAGLTIGQIGAYVLKADSSGLTQVTSGDFEVVADLAVCDEFSCTNKASTTGAVPKQTTFSTINTDVDMNNQVVLTTQFLQRITGQCAGDAGTFGQTTEVRVGGSGVTSTSPDFKVALIFPKTTLQVLGLSARNADSFNVCLGATRLEVGGGYLAKSTADGSAQVQTVADGNGVHWGWLADCSAVPAGNPCITLRTKNAGSLKAELGMTTGQFNALGFKSSDLAIVVGKPWPWDGKFTAR